MEWDWKQEAYTALKWALALLVTWGGNYARKKWKPFYQSLKKFINLQSTVGGIQLTVDLHAKELDEIKQREISMLEISTTPTFKVDANGNLFYVNGAYLDMVGANNAEDLYERGYMKVIPKEDAQFIISQTEFLIKHPTSTAGQIRYKHLQNDSIITTFCRTDVVRENGTGRVIEILGRLEILSITIKT